MTLLFWGGIFDIRKLRFFLALMRLKRKSFMFEGEVRIMIYVAITKDKVLSDIGNMVKVNQSKLNAKAGRSTTLSSI